MYGPQGLDIANMNGKNPEDDAFPVNARALAQWLRNPIAAHATDDMIKSGQ